MKNVKMELEGHVLHVTVDLSQNYGPSKSGKSQVVASTEGNVAIPGTEDTYLGLNVYVKK